MNPAGSILTERRVTLYGGGLLAGYVGAFALRFFAGKWLIDESGNPVSLDFVWIWVGAHFALARDAVGAFDYSTFSAAQAALVGQPRGNYPYYHWLYPPTVLLLIAPFALLPYIVAFFAWIFATLCFYLAAVYAILPRALAVLLAVLPFVVVENIYLGHTGFIVAGLLGFSLAFMDRRPYLSGIFLGLLTCKPQFGLLFPIVLVIAGQWRVIAGATASGLLFAIAAAVAFGPGAWVLFVLSLQGHNPSTFMPDDNLDAMHQTFFGVMHWSGAGLALTWATHLAVAILIAALVCLIWLRPVSHSLKAAALSIGALTLTPYMLAYDLPAISVPVAFLVRDALSSGFIRGERLALLGCFVSLFLCVYVPIGPIVLLVLMGLVVLRVYAKELGVSPST